MTLVALLLQRPTPIEQLWVVEWVVVGWEFRRGIKHGCLHVFLLLRVYV